MKLIDGYAVSECERQKVKRTDFHFSRRALREAITWGDTQLEIHLARLAELEYLVTHRTKCNGFEYELVYDMADADNGLRFPGLADIEALACAYDGARSGQTAAWSGSGRGPVGPRTVGGRDNESPAKPSSTGIAEDMHDTDNETHLLRGSTKIASYAQPLALAAAAAR